MIVIAIFVLIFQTMTLAGVLTLMEEKNRKAGEKNKKHVYRNMSEPEARRILRDLENEMMRAADETAANDTALAPSWCSPDGPCEYDNPEIRFPEEEIKAYLENGQRYKREEGAGNGKF